MDNSKTLFDAIYNRVASLLFSTLEHEQMIRRSADSAPSVAEGEDDPYFEDYRVDMPFWEKDLKIREHLGKNG